MKTKRIIAGFAAAVFTLSTMAVTAYAADIDDDDNDTVDALSVIEIDEDDAEEDIADDEDDTDVVEDAFEESDNGNTTTEGSTGSTTGGTVEGDQPTEQEEHIDVVENTNTLLNNEFLKLVLEQSSGKMNLWTTNGDPLNAKDNNKKLLYNGSNPYTSCSTVSVDGEHKVYGADGLTEALTYNAEDKSISGTAAYGKITVKQTVRFVRNSATGRDDVVEIKYTATNTDTAAHKVGMRIMLDTMLGSNDDAPFRVAGQDVTNETEFTGDNIPSYWQAFDSLENPTVIAQGSFLKDTSNLPDKVQFVGWPHVKKTATIWDYQIPETAPANGDSAVTVTWNEKELAPGESRTYTTHYGLSQLDQIATSQAQSLGLKVHVEQEAELKNNRYETTVTAYINNTGDTTITNPTLNIVLPEGAKLASDQLPSIVYASIAAGEERTQTWRVVFDNAEQARSYQITVERWADNIEKQSITNTINVPGYVPTSGSNGGNNQGHIVNPGSCDLPDPVEIDHEIFFYADPSNRPMVSSEGVLVRETVDNTVTVKPSAESSSSENTVIKATGGVFDTTSTSPVATVAGIVGAIAVLGAASLVVLNKKNKNER